MADTLERSGIWKYHPKSEKFGVFVNFAFANPWGHVFDHWGQNFIGDASPGNSYWAAPLSGRIDYPLKHPGGSQHRRIAKTTGGDPSYKFPTFYPKRTRPLAGCAIVSSRHFPPEMQGNFLVTNCIGDRLSSIIKSGGCRRIQRRGSCPIVSAKTEISSRRFANTRRIVVHCGLAQCLLAICNTTCGNLTASFTRKNLARYTRRSAAH